MSNLLRILCPSTFRYCVLREQYRTTVKWTTDTRQRVIESLSGSSRTGQAQGQSVTGSGVRNVGVVPCTRLSNEPMGCYSLYMSPPCKKYVRQFTNLAFCRQKMKPQNARSQTQYPPKASRREHSHKKKSNIEFGSRFKSYPPKPSLIACLMLDDERNVGNQNFAHHQKANIEQIEDIIDSIENEQDDPDTSDSDNSDMSEEEMDNKIDSRDGILENIELELEEPMDDHQEVLNPGVGTPDPNIPISNVPCSGCGALLHCQDTGIPGYMPSQKFTSTSTEKLREQVCQRCYLMQRHNLALKACVSPQEYTEIISKIKDVRALVIVVVDVMDMPNSIFPKLSELIGKKRPLYIVGNKADLLPPDSIGYLSRLKSVINQHCEEALLGTDNHIKHVGLISAKTGYGIEDLATKLMTDWNRKGSVYILGCTNAGKSTLFNALLASDYCKDTAADFINRATTSVWPGTTLNLLKFPIINPEPWRLAKRQKRLKRQRSEEQEEQRLINTTYAEDGRSYPTLMGHIGRTFGNYKNMAVDEEDSKGFSGATFSYNPDTKLVDAKVVDKEKLMGYSYDEATFEKSRWCYDTPGVVNPEQIINLLTQHELSVLLTTKTITPRSFILKPGQAMHVSGLGRIDLLQAEKSVIFTVFAAEGIPVSIRSILEMGKFYDRHVGTKVMGIPLGDKERLKQLPSLVAKPMTVEGVSFKESAGDIVLSSIGKVGFGPMVSWSHLQASPHLSGTMIKHHVTGWVAVTPGPGISASLRAYTPGGVGCTLRSPALLPYAVNMRGKRNRKAASYEVKPLKVFK